MVPMSIIFCTLEILFIVLIAFRKHQNENIDTFLPFVLTDFCIKGHNEPGTQRLSNAETVWKGCPMRDSSQDGQAESLLGGVTRHREGNLCRGPTKKDKVRMEMVRKYNRTKGSEEVGTVWIKEKTSGLRSWTPIILYEA